MNMFTIISYDIVDDHRRTKVMICSRDTEPDSSLTSSTR
jgi:hypothetical protein